MKRIRYLAPVESMSGKFSQTGITAFKSNGMAFLYGVHRSYGSDKPATNCFGLRRYGFEGAYTAAQKAVQANFRACRQRVDAMKVEEPELFQELKRAYSLQRRYKTLTGYLMHYCWDNPPEP